MACWRASRPGVSRSLAHWQCRRQVAEIKSESEKPAGDHGHGTASEPRRPSAAPGGRPAAAPAGRRRPPWQSDPDSDSSSPVGPSRRQGHWQSYPAPASAAACTAALTGRIRVHQEPGLGPGRPGDRASVICSDPDHRRDTDAASERPSAAPGVPESRRRRSKLRYTVAGAMMAVTTS